MSKRQTRRAARKAFPQAKAGTTAQRVGKRGKASGKNNWPKDSRGRPIRPPSLKRALIQGAILAILYFVVIEFIWVQKDPATGEKTTSTAASVLVAVIGFVVYSGIAYAVDKFVYQRKLRRLRGYSK